tara:strand:- start:8468 stop:8737 length:270 start_codon:yes stop_codon:yes gene_type:complete
MSPINIIQVDTPMFEYEGIKYWTEEYRFMTFNQFQDNINRKIKLGATHCFIYSVSNANSDGTPITTYVENVSDIWIRCKFVKLEDEQTD